MNRRPSVKPTPFPKFTEMLCSTMIAMMKLTTGMR